MNSSNSQDICGYLIVRLPSENRDSKGRYFYRTEAPQVNEVYYGGVERMPWFDIEEEYYTTSLPPALASLWREIKDQPDFSGITLCRDLKIARALLEYANAKAIVNELIVLRSARLAEIKGTIKLDQLRTQWIGYDIVSLGNGSLLYQGLFINPVYFHDWADHINQDGLISSVSIAYEYIHAYEAAAKDGIVEQLPDSPYGIDIIEIGRLA